MPSYRYLIGPDLITDPQAPLAEPHPTTFECSAWHIRGDGAPVQSGPWRVVWRYDGQYLSAEAWEELQSFIDDDKGYGLVYIRTRTEDTESGKYKYEVFKAIMNRPRGRPVWGQRFAEVSVDFLLIENPAKGYDPDTEVNVTLFPGTFTTTTSTSTTTTTVTQTISSTSTTITTTSTSTTSSSTSTSYTLTSTSTSTTTTSTSTSTSTSTTTTTSTSTTTTSTSTSTSTSTTTTLLEEYEFLDLGYGNDRPVSMAIDAEHGYLYVGLLTSAGRVVAVRLSDFSVAKTLILTEGEDFPYGMGIDVANRYLYVSSYTSPAKIIKIGLIVTSLDEFKKIDVITLE